MTNKISDKAPGEPDSPLPQSRVGGWVTRSREQVYDNPWIRVNHEQVTTPSGTEGIYGVVHFKSLAVGVVPIDDEGYTWLVRQSRYTLNEFTWEIPEGGAPLDEAPLAAAQRELREETGLSATRWTELMQLHTSNSVTDERSVIFVAEGLTPGEQALEATEDIEVMRLPLTAAVQMALDGEITDAMSVAALLRVQLLRR